MQKMNQLAEELQKMNQLACLKYFHLLDEKALRQIIQNKLHMLSQFRSKTLERNSFCETTVTDKKEVVRLW